MMMDQEAVVVLGHRLRSDEIHGELRGRMDVALDVASEDKAVLVLTGGQTNEDVNLTESQVMWNYATSQGLAEERILEERKALDTIGNAYFTRRLLEEDPRRFSSVRIITSCYHVPRAFYIFNHCFSGAYSVIAGPCHNANHPPPRWEERAKLAWSLHFLKDVPEGDLNALKTHLMTHHDRY